MNSRELSSNKKNVGLLIGSLAGGGAERQISRLSLALSDRYNIYIFIYTHKVDYDYKGTLVDIGGRFKTFPFQILNATFELNKELRKYNIDILISYMGNANIMNGLFNKSCKSITAIRCYYEKGNFYFASDKVKLPLLMAAHRKANAVIVQSKRQKDILKKDIGIYESVYICDNIIDIDEITNKSKQPIVDEEIENFINEYTSVTIGRLSFQKDQKRLIEIFARVHKSNSNTRLLIMGSGPDKQQLQALIDELLLRDSVMLAGNIKNPFAIISKCACFISVSLFEGFPNCLIEAMACGVPVMHTDCPLGPREALTDDSNINTDDVRVVEYGVLLPMNRDKDDSIAEYWSDLLTDREKQRKLAKSSLDRAWVYDEKNVLQQYIDVIETNIN